MLRELPTRMWFSVIGVIDMQMEKLMEKHVKFLNEKLDITEDIFRNMSGDELDALVNDELMWIESDGVDNNLPNGITDEGKLAADLIDIIYGPYNSAEMETAETA
jgi:hypothetical protein